MIENNNEQIPAVNLVLFTAYFDQSVGYPIKRVPIHPSFHSGYERGTHSSI